MSDNVNAQMKMKLNWYIIGVLLKFSLSAHFCIPHFTILGDMVNLFMSLFVHQVILYSFMG